MVLAIIGISTIIAMPSLVRSIRGNRLRVGSRTLVMAGNYARTMAILRNQEMKLTLDKAANSVTVEPLYANAPAAPEDRGFGSQPQPPFTAPPPDAGPASPTNEPTSALPPARIVRQLDAVRIDSVTVDRKKENSKEDTASVIYQGNGRCTPYEVRVVDEFGSVMVVTVDTVASTKVRKEGE